MTKHNIPLTYKPKIPKVLSGECTQTIRAGRKFQVGDLISFHGWSEKPYRSKWSFRTPYYTVVNLVPIIIKKEGIKVQSLYWGDQDMESGSKIAPLKLHPGLWEFWNWVSDPCEFLAIYDGIDPPTGEELGRVLTSYHKIPEEGLEAQIIRWKWSE